MNTHKLLFGSNNVLLNPNISRPARLLWAVLRHFEQEGKRDMKLDELVTILGVTRQTVMSYLYELREMQCLRYDWFSGVHYTTVSSVAHSPAPGNAIGLDEPSNPHLN